MYGNVDFTIRKDHYGRRVIPKLPKTDSFQSFNAAMVPPSNLRTNSRLLAIIQQGGEIPATSDPKTYADPGHVLEGVTSDERFSSALGLPLHNYRESPVSRFALSRDDVRHTVRETLARAAEQLDVKGSAADSAPSVDSGSANS